jgi:midasin
MQIDGDGADADDEDAEGSDMDKEADENDDEDNDDPMNVDENDDAPDEEDEEGADLMPVSSTGGNEPEEQPKPNEKPEGEEEKEEEEEGSDVDVKPDAGDEDESASKPAAFGVTAGDKGGEAVLGTEDNEADESPPDADTEGPKGDGARSSGVGDMGDSINTGGAAASSAPNQPPVSRDKEPPNPFREEGDVTEAWHRRLNMAPTVTEDEEEEAPRKGQQDDSAEKEQQKKGLYEYGDENDKEQVLADTSEDQAQQPQGAETMPEQSEMDAENEEQQDEKQEELPSEMKKRARSKETEVEDKESAAKKQRHEELEPAEDNKPSTTEATDDHGDGDEAADGDDEFDESQKRPNAINTDAAFNMKEGLGDDDELNSVIEEPVEMEMLSSDYGSEKAMAIVNARRLWAKHRNSTDTHSMRLCEQLRLVLEPTLATRLRGDYRSGKRINMRKVIGYVASGFRKDKIWLRRTKPAKREYQVMLMIDNSQSMGASGPLALSALATISSALTKLEVGDLCVCAFAEKVQNLHPFGTPFNDEAGAKVVSRFKFEEGRTLLGDSLSAVAPIFEEAASGSSNSRKDSICLQLCFVISDAKLDSDNRERLNGVVRRMAEKNILVVLIILDKNENPSDSIFNTKSVEFVEDKIVTKNYLDDFPFPYYIAIQQLETLPDVLSDALKQWFELISTQIDNA